MLYWAAIFLIIAIVAGLLGIGGVAVISKEIAWILFVVGLILAVITSVIFGIAATALDFGGWNEADWRAVTFAFFGAMAVIGAMRALRR